MSMRPVNEMIENDIEKFVRTIVSKYDLCDTDKQYIMKDFSEVWDKISEHG